jgi:hypothetical protein
MDIAYNMLDQQELFFNELILVVIKFIQFLKY